MLPLGGCGCNGKTGRAAWGARMNKNVAWILAILFGGAALGTWYMGRDAQGTDGTNPLVDQVQTDPAPSVAQATTDPVTTAQPKSSDPVEPPVGSSPPDAGNSSQAENDETAQTEGSSVPAPVLETARIDADGAVVIAGRAAAGAQVDILVDDAVQHSVVADAAGNFVALFDLPQSTVARSLTLRVGTGDAAVYAAQDIIIAPSQIKAAQAVAETTETAQVSQAADASDTDLVAAQSARQAAQTDAGDTTELAQGDTVQQPASDSVASVDNGSQETPVQSRLSTNDTADTQENDAPSSDTASQTQVVTAADTETSSDQISAQISAQADTAEPAQSVAVAVSSTETGAEAVADVQSQTSSAQISDAEPATSATEPTATQPTTTEPTKSEPSQPTVFAADETGVKVLQGADALPAGQIVMDAISYDAAGGVLMSGRGQAGAQLQFYLNNQLIESTEIDAQGFWAQDMSGVAPGVYTLRLDQLDAAGDVTARFETPFKREDRAALAAAAAQVAQQAAQQSSDQETQPPAGTTDQSSGTMETPQPIAPVQAITVQPGNTLWGISRARYGQGILYVRVFDANRDKIRDPDLIYPGQVFVLPSQAE